MIEQIQEHFKQHKYVVIKNFLDPKTAALFYQYSIIKVQRTAFLIENDPDNYCKLWDGEFGDKQIGGNSYACYGDVLMDSLLAQSVDDISTYTGLDLLPTYSYWRFYQPDDKLIRHVDRNSCEISTSLCLGYDVSNVDSKIYPNYNWPMFVDDKNYEKGMPVRMEPGDLVIYRGLEVEHWREPFIGLNHAQVFMHFNDKNGPFNNFLDGRPLLGIPKKFQNVD